jgi:hypothetical protein
MSVALLFEKAKTAKGSQSKNIKRVFFKTPNFQ